MSKNIGEELKQKSQKTRKKERFLRTRMWFSILVSHLFSDREAIPPNIGNNVLISNNLYMTKNSLNAMVLISELSTETPLCFVSDMIAEVKREVQNITIDVTFKTSRYNPDISGGGLESRMRTWEATLSSPIASSFRQKRAARLLYSAEQLLNGTKAYKTRIFITIRAKTGVLLNAGIRRVSYYLNSIECDYKVVHSDMQGYLEYSSLLSNTKSAKVKDIPACILTNQTYAESLPDMQGGNDKKGSFLGIDHVVNWPYMVDFKSTANAKNIYLAAPSGYGKTFMAETWLMDMFCDGYNLCIMDIKGNEFSNLTKACGGITIPLHQESTYYVNTFRLNPEEIKSSPKVYFDSRLTLSKELIMIIADLKEDEIAQGEALVEESLRSLYLAYHIEGSNPNTYHNSDSINPYVYYTYFSRYCSDAIRQRFPIVADKILHRLSIYFSVDGTLSHLFKDPLNYREILDNQVLTFDFGSVTGTSIDPTCFKVKTLFMSILNDEYVAYKKSKGQWTVKVLEEHQIAEDYLLKVYKKDITVRRAQNQITILLGNSVAALYQNPEARPILDNINILVLGKLGNNSIEYLSKEYGIANFEHLISQLKDNTFLLINKMQAKATTALLKAEIPHKVVSGSLKGVDVNED